MRTGKTILVVLAAGLGSRFGGIKQLEPVGPDGETILEYSLFDAQRAGFSEVVFIIRKAMEADFRALLLDKIRTSLRVSLAYQETDILPALRYSSGVGRDSTQNRIKPWGTGHALWCARENLDAPFAVINADDFYGQASFAILHNYLAAKPLGSDDYAMVAFELGNTLSDHGPVARGICEVNREGFLTNLVEHTRLEAAKAAEISNHIAVKRDSILPANSIVASAESHIASAERPVCSLDVNGLRSYYSRTTPVSMNLFGFTPQFLPRLENALCGFLEDFGDDPRAEFYLPGVVQGLVAAGTASVKVLSSPETWFGLTYKADLEAVRGRLQQLIGTGVYPPSLRALQ